VRYHAKACLAARERESAFQALLESRLALEQRAREVEEQKAQLELLNRELTESSYTDALTGLPNRRYLKIFLEQPAAARRRANAAGGMVFCMFDLDHFKAINDRFGHEAGDAVLVETARRLRHCLRDGDVALRWGGEEFLVIGRDHTPASARNLARRLLQSIGGQNQVLPSGHEVQVTCSLGWAPMAWTAVAPLSRDQVINLADLALYLSKIEGRNRGTGVYPGKDSEFATRLPTLSSNPGTLRDEDGRGVVLQPVEGPGEPG
jgi:diguanylate cyclase (GGDEF)-like protein